MNAYDYYSNLQAEQNNGVFLIELIISLARNATKSETPKPVIFLLENFSRIVHRNILTKFFKRNVLNSFQRTFS